MNSNLDARESSHTDGAINPIELIGMLRTHFRWWAVPAVVCAVIAAAYSLLAPRNWEASQAFIVRPEAASVSEERIGKFADLSEMKTVQETILELTKSHGVVSATLRQVGPPSRCRKPQQWPTALDIDHFRECVDMSPPGGAEFGKTEVFYLTVRDTNRDRASAIVAALSRQLEQRLQQLRDERAQSMMAELQRTVAMADGDLSGQTKRLSAFEKEIGADIVELRSLNAQVGGQGGVTQELQLIDAERRANDSQLQENKRLLKLLTSARDHSSQLLATPSSLLRSQPSVAQLKDALVAAQIRTAALLGTRSEKHPFVIAAREAEQLIRDQLHNEVAVAIRGLEVDVEIGAERERTLAAKAIAASERISRLAESRAEYANLVASVENHTRLVEAARKNLADARARQAGALSASVISRIDGVEAGVHPIGPGRKAITIAGGVGGLLFGFGLVFLFGSPGFPQPQITRVAVPTDVVAQPGVVTNGTVCTNRKTSCARNGHSNNAAAPAASVSENLFHGMTLEQAIRSVEQRS
jgi:uncharacterized protein involved in exopolysaccharide biosynthesis